MTTKMTGSDHNREVLDILRGAAKDFKEIGETFERLLEEERLDYEALPEEQRYDDPGLDLDNYIESLEDAIEKLEDLDSSMEEAIGNMEDAFREIDVLCRGI